MRFIVILALLIVSIEFSIGQNLTPAEIPGLVELVDDHVGLKNFQKQQVQKIFMESYNKLTAVQKKDKTDIEKLHLIKQNQQETHARLKMILDGNQYKAYNLLVNGPSDQIETTTTTPILSNTIPSSNTTIPPKNTSGGTSLGNNVANQLGLAGTTKNEFVQLFNQHEADLKNIVGSGIVTPETGIDLLTNILTTDFKIMDLTGRDTYGKYFNLREQGLTGGTKANGNQKVDINMVYQFYDLTKELELSDIQTEQVIRLILNNESKKQIIRQENKGNSTVVRQKIKQVDDQSLVEAQKILSQKQLIKLAQMMGK